ncbi:aldo/keto reductase [Pseudobacteroides cellulosolvens]|uniref:NADP-dependent oxidoreductase domain containing protein n=1 Tax=Pseudobacteroides cellulosolvens ATCC 35603 = DSM 2933 TaxID=398512 RepID=A0A0L6JQ22_9FIRM|nr:aldo/keto reductase [Pseudobacteroides cellulosolvens]KNY27883.1 NADP-dependent oxidoreductase domain containing protein [Pseudobacteroides cellulosolvens ATCC 35603 = DSM 2933]
MKYRVDPKSGNELSVLGFGCMRFPRARGSIDIQKTESIILQAIDQGVNYFDTAYIYGASEETLGNILKKNSLREEIYLATKLPLVYIRNSQDFDQIFNKQLERLQTNTIDYYLMHNITSLSQWEKLCNLGVEDWIKAKKAEGSIKQIGFSFHGIRDEFLKTIDAYDWDFCQIQYNYANENFQAGVTGLKRAHEKGMAVIIMEPLLGGKLANGLPKEAVDMLRKANPDLSPAAWALKWLWNQPEVTVVLSGMNGSDQVKENLFIADTSYPFMLSNEENKTLKKANDIFEKYNKIACTGCNYCMPCPKNVNIPSCFAAYNASYSLGRITGMTMYITSSGAMSEDGQSGASLCSKCGKCEAHCPQNIKIRDALVDVRKRMEPFWYRFGTSIARRVLNRKR